MTDRTIESLFPCAAPPGDDAVSRLAGLYPQRQEGLWMQRVKLLGGRATPPQWLELATLADEFIAPTPLHLTTRQELEFHDIPAARVAAMQQQLAQAGMTGAGACGDTPRNVTVGPLSGALDGTPDLEPLAWQIRRMLEQTGGIFSLPRKFKISLSAAPHLDGQPWLNDIGLVVVPDGGGWAFTAIVGGSLGAKPGTGMLLEPAMAADEVLPLVAGIIDVFAAHGDRQNRRRARLRHVRERVGDEAFAQMIREATTRAKVRREFPPVQIPIVRNGCHARRTLTFANGDLAPAVARALGALAGRSDLLVRIGNQHQVLVFGRDDAGLSQAIAGHPCLAGAARPQAAIVACPGIRWCRRALTDTNAAADAIRRELGDVLPASVAVCISGCPNGCAHTAVADVGLGGVLAADGGVKQERYNLSLGGGMGRSPTLAEPKGQKLTLAAVLEAIRSFLAAKA